MHNQDDVTHSRHGHFGHRDARSIKNEWAPWLTQLKSTQNQTTRDNWRSGNGTAAPSPERRQPSQVAPDIICLQEVGPKPARLQGYYALSDPQNNKVATLAAHTPGHTISDPATAARCALQSIAGRSRALRSSGQQCIRYCTVSAIKSAIQLDAGIEAAKAEADATEEELLIVNNLMMTIDSVAEQSVNRDRWSFSRRTRWFEETVPLLGEKFFKRAFRVTPATFRYTVDAVRPLLERQNTIMREAIALDKRPKHRSDAELFAVGRSTVNVAYREFCEAVIQTMEAEWIKMPTASSMAEHIRRVHGHIGIPAIHGITRRVPFPRFTAQGERHRLQEL
ncbi:hypothetical protein HPB49_024712 [Dermacentor silvarum]|uniref:Uncharacterized protein n=1 Tax=Dermacentor silvarum TaxID=543639 RepID=A0ACB8D912_DERSI|nr:hypothetical protein HPB49_024712 [Dermacentor silvarum]